MKKNFSFLISLILILIPLHTGFAAGQNEGNAADSDKTELTFGYYREELFGGNYDASTDAMIQAIQDEIGITLTPKWVTWADAGEKYKLWAVAGELPDFMGTLLDELTYQNWIKQGILRSLPEDLSSYPNISEVFSREDVQILAIDDKYYTFPRQLSPYPEGAETGFLIRKDWMEQAGLDMPATYDDFIGTIKTLQSMDMDGNGKNDTNGIMVKSARYWDPMIQSDMPYFRNKFWKNVDGEWRPYFMLSEMKDAIVNMGELYSDGVLYKDFMLLKDQNVGLEKFCYGNTAALTVQVDSPRLQQVKDAWTKYNPEKEFSDCVAIVDTFPFASEDGNRYARGTKSYWAYNYFNGEVDDAKMGKILDLHEFMLSEKGSDLWYLGFEGKDYAVENGEVKSLLTPEADGSLPSLLDSYPSAMFWGGIAYWGNDRVYYNMDPVNLSRHDRDIVDMSLNYALKMDEELVMPDTSWAVTEYANRYLAAKKFGATVKDDIVASIMSSDPAAAWDNVLEKYRKMNIETLIDEINAGLREKNIQ